MGLNPTATIHTFLFKLTFGLLSVSVVKASASYLLHAGFLLGLFFDLEDGGDIFLRKVG
jgi:hypothetical protein